MTALGFIETKGLLAGIEAADAMLKAANVRLIGSHLVGGGLVTIIIEGEVSAVRASVDAAITAVMRIDGAVLVSEHVIARPYEEVSQIIATKESSIELVTSPHGEVEAEPQAEPEPPNVEQDSPPSKNEEKAVAFVEVEETLTVESTPVPEDAAGEVTEPPEKEQQQRYTISKLKKTAVSRLRQIALTLSDISLTKQEIKAATKKKLIEVIFNATNR